MDLLEKGNLNPDGSIYNGDFVDSQFSGKGTITWPDGEQYSGDWKNGVMSGTGTYNFSNVFRIC